MKVRRLEWDGTAPAALARELRSLAPAPAEIRTRVAELVEAVRTGGEEAAIELAERVDGVRVERLAVPPERVAELAARADPELREALTLAAENIRSVAAAPVRPAPVDVEPGQGQRIRVAEVPVAAAGIYVPGGRAPYPSTALMGVIAARCAGVGRVVVATPPGPDGAPDPAVCAAVELAGADAVYAVGGAQAIAALAYGTDSVEPVDVIAGPGGPWVQEAKLVVSRSVGIDGYAGPSELLVITDGSAEREWLALDLCAQAEHGDDGLLVAVATGSEDAERLAAAIEAAAAERSSVAAATVSVLTAPDVTAALALSEALAPEHLELACAGAEALADEVTTAGCVLVGAYGATAFGDYAAGSNHVLPTGGAGRFSGPLGPGTFRRTISIVRMTPEAAVELGGVVETIAAAEGFEAHGASATARAAGARTRD